MKKTSTAPDTTPAPKGFVSLLQLWRYAEMEFSVVNRLVGGTPTDPLMIEGWLRSNMKSATGEERQKIKETTLDEIKGAVDDAAKSMWTTFKRDDLGPYVEGRCLKAAFKEAASVLREMLTKADRRAKGEGKDAKSRYTNLKSKVAERLFVDNEKIRIYRNGVAITLNDVKTEERPIHVDTPQGPRTALKRYDFIEAPATLRFQIRYLDDGIVDEPLIATMIEYMQSNGLLADRSQGNGLFRVVGIRRLDAPAVAPLPDLPAPPDPDV